MAGKRKMEEAKMQTKMRKMAACCTVLMVAMTLSSALLVGQEKRKRNLKVLPVDIPRKELGNIMRSFTYALGVDCMHSHVGDDEWGADEKEAKETARKMLKMTKEINASFVSKIAPGGMKVRCVTCHNGKPKPETIDSILKSELAENGLDATLAKYKTLRADHFGSFSYDFRVGTLNRLARQLALNKKMEDARKVVDLNLVYYPESADAYFMLGEIYRAQDDVPGAVKQYKKALEFDPAHRNAKRRIKALENE